MKLVQMVAVVLIAQGMAGCSGPPVAGPSAPSGPLPPPIATTASKPSISMISPDTGSIYGGNWITVMGEFDRNATATIGGTKVGTGWSPTDPAKHFLHGLAPHTPGPVDIVVTNADGGSQRFAGAYTYADPGAFDLNGAWDGVTFDGSDTLVAFTVRENVLTRVQCIDAFNKSIELELSAPVVNGKVEFIGDAGRFSAWVASASEAAGTIDIVAMLRSPALAGGA